jgi:hypothetical protein
MLAVFVEIADARVDGVLRLADVDLAAVHEHLAAIHRIGAENGARDFGAAGAHQPREAEYLALVQREADVLDFRSAAEAREDTLARRAGTDSAAAYAKLGPALAEYRRLGYRIGSSQQIRGVEDITVPVLAFGGRAVAALTYPYIERLDDAAADIDQTLAALREIAAALPIGSAPSGGGA